MELRSHIKIVSEAKWFIVVFTALVAIAALVYVTNKPTTYQAVTSFDIAFVSAQDTPDYQYAAYYDQRSSEIFAQNIMSWMKTPAVVIDVYDRAGVGYQISSIGQFTARFRAKQYSAQNVVIQFSDTSFENAQKLSNAIVEVVEERSAQAAQVDGQPIFAVNGLEPVVVEQKLNVYLVGFVAAVAGVILSIILVYLREYFRK